MLQEYQVIVCTMCEKINLDELLEFSLYISVFFNQGLYCEEYTQELEMTGMGRRIMCYQNLGIQHCCYSCVYKDYVIKNEDDLDVMLKGTV